MIVNDVLARINKKIYRMESFKKEFSEKIVPARE